MSKNTDRNAAGGFAGGLKPILFLLLAIYLKVQIYQPVNTLLVQMQKIEDIGSAVQQTADTAAQTMAEGDLTGRASR